MFKYRVTNTSGEREHGAHARPIFLTEAGRLLQPGDVAPINRLDKGTQEIIERGDLRLEEGDFPAYVPPKKPKPKPRDDDDDDQPRTSARKVEDKTPAKFHDVKAGQNKKSVPMIAPGAQDEPEKEDEEVLSASTAGDDEPDDIPAVTKADLGKKDEDADEDDSAPSAAAAGFTDNFRVGKKD